MSPVGKDTRIWLPTRLVKCRSQVEAQWGLFLAKCEDVYRVEHEPELAETAGRWIPDYAIEMSDGRKMLCEVKFDEAQGWREEQFTAAMEMLTRPDEKAVDGVLLLLDGGFFYRYEQDGWEDIDSYKHRVRWTDFLTVYRRRDPGHTRSDDAYLIEAAHIWASQKTRAAYVPPWRLFPEAV